MQALLANEDVRNTELAEILGRASERYRELDDEAQEALYDQENAERMQAFVDAMMARIGMVRATNDGGRGGRLKLGLGRGWG